MYIKNEMPLEVDYKPIVYWNFGLETCVYWNPANGIKSTNIEDVQDFFTKYQFIERTETLAEGLSIQYDKEHNLVCVIYCILDLDERNKEKRSWEEVDRIYFGSDWSVYRKADDAEKGIFNRQDVIVVERKGLNDIYVSIKENWENLFFGYPKNNMVIINSPYMVGSYSQKEWYQWELMEPFRNLFEADIVPMGENQMLALDSLSSLRTFFEHPSFREQLKLLNGSSSTNCVPLDALPPLKTKIPSSLYKRQTSMENMDLSNISLLGDFSYEKTNVRSVAVAEKLEGEDAVAIRLYYVPIFGQSCNLIEGRRWIFYKDRYIFYVRYRNVFVECNRGLQCDTPHYSMSYYKDCNMPLLGLDRKVLKGTMLESMGRYLENEPYNIKMTLLWNFITRPESLELYKIDSIRNIMKAILCMHIEPNYDTINPIQMLKHIVVMEEDLREKAHYTWLTKNSISMKTASEDDKTDSIYGMLNLNEYQMKLLVPLVEKYFIPTMNKHPMPSVYESPIISFKKIAKAILCNRDNAYCDYAVNFSVLDDETSEWIVEHVKKAFKTWGIHTPISQLFKNEYGSYEAFENRTRAMAHSVKRDMLPLRLYVKAICLMCRVRCDEDTTSMEENIFKICQEFETDDYILHFIIRCEDMLKEIETLETTE